MEEDLNNEINEAEFATGFNWGYLLAEHETELSIELKGGMELKSDFESGLFHGINEYNLEKEKARIAEAEKLIDKDKDIDRDIKY